MIGVPLSKQALYMRNRRSAKRALGVCEECSKPSTKWGFCEFHFRKGNMAKRARAYRNRMQKLMPHVDTRLRGKLRPYYEVLNESSKL